MTKKIDNEEIVAENKTSCETCKDTESVWESEDTGFIQCPVCKDEKKENTYLIAWSHINHGSGNFQTVANSAEEAANDGAQHIAEMLAEDETDELEKSTLIDDMTVKVWKGRYVEQPEKEPDFILT